MDTSGIYDNTPLQRPLTLLEFIKQPRALLKLTIFIISIIGLGCSTNGCMLEGHSIFHNDSSASHFAVAVAVIGFLFSLISLICDYFYDKTANIKRRRHFLISDIAGTGLLALLNFVEFCYLTNRWSNTENSWLDDKGFEQWQRRNARSIIFFAFVAIVVWGGLNFMALIRFRGTGQGLLSRGFAPSSTEPETGNSVSIDEMYPPPSATGLTPPHQQQPMGGGNIVNQSSYYPPPTY